MFGYRRNDVSAVVGVGIGKELVDLAVVEPSQCQVEIETLQFLEFRPKQLQVPIRFLMAAVVHKPEATDLLWGEIMRHMHGNLAEAFLACCRPAQMSDDDSSSRSTTTG